MDNWKRIRDKKMRWRGDIDYDNKVIRINPSKKKNKKPGELLDTIVHEETHRLHPRMWEKTIRKETKHKIKSMSREAKQKLYNKYN